MQVLPEETAAAAVQIFSQASAARDVHRPYQQRRPHTPPEGLAAVERHAPLAPHHHLVAAVLAPQMAVPPAATGRLTPEVAAEEGQLVQGQLVPEDLESSCCVFRVRCQSRLAQV